MIKFRVRRRDGRLIGYIRFEAGRWQCQMLKAAGGSEEWSSGVLHGSIIEQFTGLRDMTGQDIFEGDVAKLPNGNIREVKWHEEGYWSFGLHLRYSEVIGDIHSNPDLLSPEGNK